MTRFVVSWVFVVMLATGAGLWSAPVTPEKEKKANEKKPAPVLAKVAQPINFEGIDDVKATLSDALGYLTALSDVTFTVNEAAFKQEQLEDVLCQPVVGHKPIPKMTSASLDTVLRQVLSRIVTQSGATYMVRRDRIEITTGAFQMVEVWGPDYKGPVSPLVHAVFEKRPLEDALKELADFADFNVLLDGRCADKGKTLVTARLVNTPFDSAVLLLADMADLKSVRVNNVVYVTTKENAVKLEAEQRRLEKERQKKAERDNQLMRPEAFGPWHKP